MTLEAARPSRWRIAVRLFFGALLAFAPVHEAFDASAPVFEFRIDEGRNINAFVRERDVSAHLVLRSGTQPRLLVAFPAGNSGVGVWFQETRQPVTWTLMMPLRPMSTQDEKGRALHGIEAEVVASTGTLAIDRAALSSVRVLRDVELLGAAPEEVVVAPTLSTRSISWQRDRLDGAAGYRLTIEALDDVKMSADGAIVSDSGRLRLRVRALTGERPLTPLAQDQLLTRSAREDARSRNVLTFLSYREKYLAGSWRFDTYFGRDTLLSLYLLAPALTPTAMESGIASVLTRLAPNGEVAHEEDIGEFAILRNEAEGRGRIDAPIYDYGMVDDDFMLAPLAARWFLHGSQPQRVRAFLDSPMAGGERHGDALVRNLRWIVERTAEFSKDPRATNLVSVKPGRMTGQWRDSEEGLGRGRYAYDVNAVFVPAALQAADRLLQSGTLDPYLEEDERRILENAGVQARNWARHAPALFATSVPADRARDSIRAYAGQIGVDSEAALKALGSEPVSFSALSLDASGQPVPVMHSDVGFALLFTMPSAAELARTLDAVMRPFPVGLFTPVGILISNPAFADRSVQLHFTNEAYHGTVVWSWQQAVLAAGIDRQLGRRDLPPEVRQQLNSARGRLWSAIDATRSVRTSELWSWTFSEGRYRVEPFGARRADVDESNAAQLWSTVFLAIRRPSRRPSVAQGELSLLAVPSLAGAEP